jgi:hypothetical protein
MNDIAVLVAAWLSAWVQIQISFDGQTCFWDETQRESKAYALNRREPVLSCVSPEMGALSSPKIA